MCLGGWRRTESFRCSHQRPIFESYMSRHINSKYITCLGLGTKMTWLKGLKATGLDLETDHA